MAKKQLLGWCLALLLLPACAKKKVDPVTPTPIPPPTSFMEMPAAFGQPVYGTSQFPVTEAGFKLGKALFFDPVLSEDSTISCASCHHAEAAFADPNKAVSDGILQRPGDRNSPPVQNLAWRTNFMWDGGVTNLELQPINPISNPKEMGADFAAAVQRAAALPRYKALSQAAFNSDTLTSQRLLKGLAQFMATLVSAHSPYDKYMAGDLSALNAVQIQGMALFADKGCSTCHKPPFFTDQTYRNNGLSDFFYDQGRGKITHDATDDGKFLVPSLRNVAVTGPYMHDGRFQSLDDVLSHYSGTIVPSATLDPSLPTPGIAMSQEEKDAIKAFLQGLTDSTFLSNTKFRP